MPTRNSFDYAVLRVVPRVEAAGIPECGRNPVLSRKTIPGGARAHRQPPAWPPFWPELDLDTVRQHAEAFVKICRGDPDAGPIAHPLPARAFPLARRSPQHHHSSFPVHTGLCDVPQTVLNINSFKTSLCAHKK